MKIFPVAFFATLLYGCAAVPVIYAVDASQWEKRAVQAEASLKPFVDYVEVKIDKSVTASTLRVAGASTVVLEDDMKTVKNSPSLLEKEFGKAVMEEMFRSLSIPGATVNILASETLHIEVLYVEGRELSRKRYYSNGGGFWSSFGSNEKQLNQYRGIRKGADLRLTLRRGDTVLMEARGFWGGNAKADEIAGARQLARAIAAEMLKKLNAPASTKKE